MATVGTEMDEVRREAVKCPSWVTLRPKRPCRTRVPAGLLRPCQRARRPSACHSRHHYLRVGYTCFRWFAARAISCSRNCCRRAASSCSRATASRYGCCHRCEALGRWSATRCWRSRRRAPTSKGPLRPPASPAAVAAAEGRLAPAAGSCDPYPHPLRRYPQPILSNARRDERITTEPPAAPEA